MAGKSRDDTRASAPLLDGKASRSSGYNTQVPEPPQDYYYEDYDDDNDFRSSEHFSKYKNTYWAVLALVAIPLIYIYFEVTLGIEPNYIRVPDLVRVDSVQPHHSPNHKHGNRMILIGDVHGKMKSLKRLLAEVEFQKGTDHVVFLGDAISKGPNSIAVLDYAMSINASCVRGNHEDSVLNEYAGLHHLPSPRIEPAIHPESTQEKKLGTRSITIRASDKDVARKLRPEHIQYLGTCPAILELGKVGFLGTNAVAVHAGLQWNIDNLQDQDPLVVFTIRSLLPPTYTVPSEETEGVRWAKLWNKHQKKKPKKERLSVFYGHDARKGLNIRKYTAGIDTGCVSGGDLTALVISKDELGNVLHDIRSVPC